MQQARDTKSAMNDATAAQTESLPAWDLSDLYPSPDSKEVAADLAWAEQRAKAFAQAHAGTLASLSGAALGTGHLGSGWGAGVGIRAGERVDPTPGFRRW